MIRAQLRLAMSLEFTSLMSVFVVETVVSRSREGLTQCWNKKTIAKRKRLGEGAEGGRGLSESTGKSQSIPSAVLLDEAEGRRRTS